MTRIRRVRLRTSLGIFVAALLALPGTAAAASINIQAPGSINHNKTYRVTVSGSVGKNAYAILVYQHRGCSKTYPENQDKNASSASGGSLIFKKVSAGLFDRTTATLRGGVKGSVDYCAYLYGAKQSLDSKPLARQHKKVIFT
jgi:hypothetical protein